MSETTVGFVGTGPTPEEPSRHGHAMAYRHAEAFERTEHCRLVGCADIVLEHGLQFAEHFDIPDNHVYDEYGQLLEAADPDIVSICTPPETHADLVVGCAERGVDAIHCEKPMADTWGDSKRMAAVAADHDVQLTFNHQRRFGTPFRNAKSILDDGRIGDLRRVEFEAFNLYDYGTHSFDLCNYYANEANPEWLIGQIDYRRENRIFGAHNENQGIAYWTYDNGVEGIAATGPESSLVDCHHRLVGEDGVVEINRSGGPTLRYRTAGSKEWESVECGGESMDEQVFIDRAIADVVESLRSGTTSPLRAERALRATELAFATWESSRRRGRVDFPLCVDDNPLREMVDAGDLNPAPRQD